MNNLKKISVCIPTYNREKDLTTLISTISDDVKIEISNNGEELETIENNERLTIQNQRPSIPMFNNWNAAAKMATTDYIFITSDDDIYNANAFDVINTALDTHPDFDVYLWGINIIDSQYVVMTENKFTNSEYEIFEEGMLFSKYPYSIPFRMPSICIRREFAEKLGFFNTDMKITAADSEFLHKCFLLGKCYVGNEVIAGYRVWDKSLTNVTNATEQWFVDLDIWVNTITKLAKENGKLELIPLNFREKIMYDNIRSALSTMKKNKNGIKDQLTFLFTMCRKRYIQNLQNISKAVIKVFV